MGQDHQKKTTIGPDDAPLCHCISQLGAFFFFKTMILAAEFNTENMKLYDIGVFLSYTKLAALPFFYSS